MEKLLLENLARTQAFDEVLRAGSEIDRLSARYVQQVMFTPDAGARGAALAKLQAEILAYFERQALPAAATLGVRNARTVLSALPPELRARGLGDATLRRQVLIDGKRRPATRLRIAQHLVRDRANTLDNRLAAYWLEPGPSDREKLRHLVELHKQQDAAQKRYARQLSEHAAGRGPKPRKPNVDYMARFTQDVKTDLRAQARRAGTDAETAHFVTTGYQVLAWVTVNAGEACPQCRERQGIKGDLAWWDGGLGRPGSGKTYCGANCFCMLVPAQTLTASPALQQKGLEVPRAAQTTPADQRRVDDARDDR